jgi:hypothetical protein
MMGNLFDESPTIQKLKEQWREEGRITVIREAIMTIVKAWFPSLTELAQQKLTQKYTSEQLSRLHQQILSAPDEVAARTLLMSTDGENVQSEH